MKLYTSIKIIVIRILYIFIITITSHEAFSQIIDNGQSHFATRWRQINTPHYQLIFPDSFSKPASSLSKKIDEFIKKTSQDLDIKPKKISIVIDNNHLQQNGFVQLAPRKSEVYPVPSGASTNEEWLPNLLIHEMRHVAQFDKMTGKFTKPFFEQLGFALFGLHLPSWFFEGDAVEMETLLTQGGRGKLASWKMPIFTHIKEEEEFSLNKYLMGSYKDLVPSFYTMGYLMNHTLTQEKGLDIKEKIMSDMKKHWLRPYNFDKSLRKYYGGNTDSLYKNTLKNIRLNQKDSLQKTAENIKAKHIITPHIKYPTQYLLAQTNNGKTLYTLVSGPEKRDQIIAIDEKGKAKKVVEPGLQLTPYYHLRKNEITWDEYQKHPRYSKNTYSNIHILDLETGKQKSITHKTRYYSPYFHPEKDQLLVVHVDKENNSSLLSLDSKTGKIHEKIFEKEGLHIQQPAFNENGNKIVFIGISDKGTSLFEIDVLSKSLKQLLPWDNQQYERPQYMGDIIIFKAHFNEIDQLYALKKQGIVQLTHVENGAFYPTVYKKKVLFSDYHSQGHKVAIIDIDSFLKTDTVDSIVSTPHLSKIKSPRALQVEEIDSSMADPKIEKYSSLTPIFNFHSLSLSGNNFESFDNFKPGIFWYANDLLNHSQIRLGYEYDLDIRKSVYSAEWLYQKFPPIFSLKYKNRGQISAAKLKNKPDSTLRLDWREHIYSLDIMLPFSQYRRNHTVSYGLNMGTSYLKRYGLSPKNIRNFRNEIAFPLHYQIYFHRNQMRSKMDLAPRWGQGISVTYRHLPFEDKSTQKLSLRTNFYFPGIRRNHSFHIRYAMQFGGGLYSFTNDIPLVTGYEFIRPEKLNNTLLTSYAFPIAYPDWSLGRLAYIKRFHASIFSDFQNVEVSKMQPASYGMALYADANFFRFPAPNFTLGVKVAKIHSHGADKNYAFYYTFAYTY